MNSKVSLIAIASFIIMLSLAACAKYKANESGRAILVETAELREQPSIGVQITLDQTVDNDEKLKEEQGEHLLDTQKQLDEYVFVAPNGTVMATVTPRPSDDPNSAAPIFVGSVFPANGAKLSYSRHSTDISLWLDGRYLFNSLQDERALIDYLKQNSQLSVNGTDIEFAIGGANLHTTYRIDTWPVGQYLTIPFRVHIRHSALDVGQYQANYSFNHHNGQTYEYEWEFEIVEKAFDCETNVQLAE